MQFCIVDMDANVSSQNTCKQKDGRNQGSTPAERRQLNLRIYPDEVLRQISSPVEKFDRELKHLFYEMLVLMRQSGGIGLAGPQAGISRRLFVCEIDKTCLCLANPKITVSKGEDLMPEGCLSLPGVECGVKRSEQILIKGYDAEGIEKKYRMTGLWARVVQHEFDHLDGILITDRTADSADADRQDI